MKKIPHSKQPQQDIHLAYEKLRKKENLLPIKVSSFYEKKIKEELMYIPDGTGPLHRVIYPSQAKLTERSYGEVKDSVGDRVNMPEELVHVAIRKYKDRLLFLPTTVCAAHCQYCFRQDLLSEKGASHLTTLATQIDALEHYLHDHPTIKEVILSGGDPMTLSLQSLKGIFERLKNTMIRLHSKTLVFAPHIYTEEKIALLAKHHVRLVHHIVHPYEVCETVVEKIHELHTHGIRQYNQFPILRNINDHADVIKIHLQKLDELHIRNISMFMADPVHYSTAFRVRYERILSLMRTVRHTSPSWIHSTRMVLDSPIGKVCSEDHVREHSGEKDKITFEREGKTYIYHDISEEVDIPGSREKMLWKGAPNSL